MSAKARVFCESRFFLHPRECAPGQARWVSACQLTAEPSALRGQKVSQWEGDMSALLMLMSAHHFSIADRTPPSILEGFKSYEAKGNYN